MLSVTSLTTNVLLDFLSSTVLPATPISSLLMVSKQSVFVFDGNRFVAPRSLVQMVQPTGVHHLDLLRRLLLLLLLLLLLVVVILFINNILNKIIIIIIITFSLLLLTSHYLSSLDFVCKKIYNKLATLLGRSANNRLLNS